MLDRPTTRRCVSVHRWQSSNVFCTLTDRTPSLRITEKGGTCTFCGSRVALTYAERGQIPGQAAASQPPAAATASAAGEAQPQAAVAPQPAPAAPAVAAAAAVAEAAAAAVAFKDRLVDYDRNSAKRTSVIDDQSDYFEIDANAWLTDEVRGNDGIVLC